MNDYLTYAKQLRSNEAKRHYNCAQAALIPFATELGLEEEMVAALCENFGSGLKVGSLCGAIVGGLMALGLHGIQDPASIKRYYDAFRENHAGCLDCKDLLRINAEAKRPQKEHCDDMIYEAVALVEQMIKEKQ